LPDALNLLVRHHAAVSGCPSTQGSGQKRLLWGADPRGRFIERALRMRSDEAKCCVFGQTHDAKEGRPSSRGYLHVDRLFPSSGYDPFPAFHVKHPGRRDFSLGPERCVIPQRRFTRARPGGATPAESAAGSLIHETGAAGMRFHVKHRVRTATAPEGQAQMWAHAPCGSEGSRTTEPRGRSAVLG
jgi:hypothetical protein